MAGYIGTTPVPQATQHRESFTATGGQTSFATAGYTPQFIDVYLNGVKLAPADYTATNGSDVVLASGATASDILEIVAYTPFEVANQTFTGDTSVTNLAVTGTFTSRGIDDNADAVAITIDSSENVGIGTSSPSANLEIAQSGNNVGLLVSGGGYNYTAKFESSDAEANIIIEDSNSTNDGNRIGVATNDMYFITNTSEAMRIDSSGKVGIGTSSPQTIASGYGALTVGGTTGGGINFNSTGSAFGQIYGNNTNLVVSALGNRRIAFNTNDTERMRIDSNGFVGILNTNPQDELHIGATDATNHDAIIRLNSGGATGSRAGIAFHYEATATARARLSVNASTLELEADINGANVAAFNGNGLKFPNGNGIDFSASEGSGATSSLLDDYEEGTWTPTGNGITYSSAFGSYVKVGRLVMVTFNVTFPATSDTNSARIESLPFTVTTGNAYQSGAYVTASNAGTIIDDTYFTISTSRFLLRNNGNGDRDNNQYSARFIQGSAVYMTD